MATTSSRASSAALAAGVKSVALVASNDGARPSRPSKSARLSSTALKWLAARIVLSRGWPTLLLDPRTALIRDPSRYFSRDSDVEVASDGRDDVTAYGYDNVVDDPEMDWSRFCHGGRVLTSDPGFALLMPTEESAKLAGLVFGRVVAEAARVSPERVRSDLSDAAEGAADADFEHLAFNEALFLPSHGAYGLPERHQADPELHVLREQQARVPFPSQGPKSPRTAPSTRRSPCGSPTTRTNRTGSMTCTRITSRVRRAP